jgi:hypothetical protein
MEMERMADVDQLGPVDWLVVEFPGKQPTGQIAPHLIDLVDRGLIRILDLAFVHKEEDGSVVGLNLADLDLSASPELIVFEGASSGLIGDDDRAEVGNALAPGASGAVLLYENTWAAPFAAALRRGGAQLVASGPVEVDALLESLDAAEAADAGA